jgi:ATP-dependent RNA helicase DDX47/RRP3
MDEADRLLDMDFGPIIDQILKVIPRERTTYLFSATMTTKVAKLQRASLADPARIEVTAKCAPPRPARWLGRADGRAGTRRSRRCCSTTCSSRSCRRTCTSSRSATRSRRTASWSSRAPCTTRSGAPSALPRTGRALTGRGRLAIILRTLGFPAVPLHGQLSQSARLGALAKFKSGGRRVLIATDVASRCVPPALLSTHAHGRAAGWTSRRSTS